MEEILSLALRPRTFGDMVGQAKITKAIQQHYGSKREPRAWLFIGDSGSGKTTLARVLALSLQCKHQQEFGSPCEDCFKKRTDFDIIEINAAEITGVEAVGQLARETEYLPMPPSRRKVFIMDEAHQLSNSSQNLLLKYFEDSPKTTCWIINTTDPQKIIRALRSRCITYPMAPLTMKATTKLIDSAVKATKAKVDKEALLDQLFQQKVTSPRDILMAFEKFVAGASAEAAVMGGEASIDTLRLCRAVAAGDWEGAKDILMVADANTARVARSALAGYLRSILTQSQGSKATMASDCIDMLATASRVEDSLQVPYTLSIVYKITKRFTK